VWGQGNVHGLGSMYIGEDNCLDDAIASSIDRLSARARRERYIDHWQRRSSDHVIDAQVGGFVVAWDKILIRCNDVMKKNREGMRRLNHYRYRPIVAY
jgi:hypothetical protein